ncbi:3-oxoacyl-[acyl-carrier protein] reductase [Desulfofustis glycolicus DSM 9705]|uniref:3-oxoacyl-[acyl-carrier protein] reductase n=2 Tax=Desulfofustis glycolicus TaxID=51195 RepID=A0A1M5Y8X9_9BACT|nr:3-oxoacyl-[acyl-carrier protein] reductase [Desulfofustis glycolicus DSM 9705]
MGDTMNLRDRIVLIPGASRPVGRAIARRFGGAGASLALPVHHDWPESTAEMEQEFSGAGYRFHCYRCNLTDPDDTARLIDSVTADLGGLHHLINNIERGGMPVVHGSYETVQNDGQWQLEFETTLRAKWFLFRRALPLLTACGCGSVVNISSIAALVGRCGPASLLFNDGYSAANRGIASFTEQWAREAAPAVRVNEVMLGLVRGRHGEETRGWQALTERQRRDLLDHTLLHRTGTPEEIAELVFFVAVQAGFVTGTVIRADGGYCLGGEPVASLPPGLLAS